MRNNVNIIEVDEKYLQSRKREDCCARLINPNHGSQTGFFYSRKNGRRIAVESTLERDFTWLLEYVGSVSAYWSQPLTIYFELDGKIKQYTPDFLAAVYPTYKSKFHKYYNHRPCLIEVKYKEDLKKSYKENLAKYNVARHYAELKGWDFIFITERIRTPFLRNVKFLLPYAYKAGNPTYVSFVNFWIKKLIKTTPNYIISKTTSWEIKGRVLYNLWIQVSHGFIGCDLSEELSMDSEIWYIDFKDEN